MFGSSEKAMGEQASAAYVRVQVVTPTLETTGCVVIASALPDSATHKTDVEFTMTKMEGKDDTNNDTLELADKIDASKKRAEHARCGRK